MTEKTHIPTKNSCARQLAAELHAAGKKVRPRDVVKLLAARAIADYYQKQGRWPAKIGVTNARPLVVPETDAHVLLALKFAKDCDGIANARKAVACLADFVEPAAH